MNDNKQYHQVPKLKDIMGELEKGSKDPVIIKKGAALGPTEVSFPFSDKVMRTGDGVPKNLKKR